MTERFQKILEDEGFYLTDTQEHPKTLQNFIDEIKTEYLEDGYSTEDIEEIANENYNEYLYENSMTATEIVDKLNKYYKELTLLKRHLKSAKDYLEGGYSKKAIELLKIAERDIE